MTAGVIQDRRVTDLAPGFTYPAFVDGSRLFWALPSPVHEGLGVRASSPTGYKVMRCFPHAFTAQSRITTPCCSLRDPLSRTLNSRAERTAGRDEETASGRTKKLAEGRHSHGPAMT